MLLLLLALLLAPSAATARRGGLSMMSSVQQHSKSSPRVFHPAFPLELLKPLSDSEVSEVERVRSMLRSSTSGDDFSDPASTGLPWMPLPRIGVSDSQNVWSRKEIAEAFERNRHLGHVVWAEKLSRPEKGCFLLNHWKQSAMYLQEYDPARGARGYEVRSGSGSTEFVNWPPLALEIELADHKWQAVRVSDNIADGSVLQLLPPGMPKAAWELVFLLLLRPDQHAAELQALFDTGLSPKQGLVAYMRLLAQVQRRAESFDEVPSYRMITELDITPPDAA